jgi:periplasmic protein TonB
MHSLPRTLILSLLLHSAALVIALSYVPKNRELPVVVELSISRLSGGATGEPRGILSEKETRSPAPKDGASSVAPKMRTPRTIIPTHDKAAMPKTAEKTAHLPPPPVPVASFAHAPETKTGERAVPADKQASGSAPRPGSSGAESTPSRQDGGAGQKGSLSGGPEGGGGSVGNGRSGNGPGTGAENVPEHLRNRYRSEQFAYIKKIIEGRLVYPKKARREGLTGRAFVSFTVLEDGQVAGIKILRSTGYEILDLNVIETIKSSAPFPKPPIKAELRMPITYSLGQ